MKLFLLDDPMRAEQFARFVYSGTWTKGQLCPVCRRGTSELVPPLLIEWEEGSDFLGDLAWAGGSYMCIAPQPIRQALAFLDPDVDWGEVRVLPPERKRARRRRVPYPYTGPKLWWLQPKHRVFINWAEAAKLICPGCGEYVGQFRRSGIVLRAEEVGRRQIFRLAENGRSPAMFVPEDAAKRIVDAGVCNVALLEAGEIVG